MNSTEQGRGSEPCFVRQPVAYREDTFPSDVAVVSEQVTSFKGKLGQWSYSSRPIFMDRFFPVIPISAAEDKILLRRMQNDKKNEHGEILCTLLDTVGFYMVNVALSPEEVKEAFQHYREEYGLV